MSCAVCSTKTLRYFLRSFNYLETHDPAKPRLPYNVRQPTKRPFNTSSSNNYRSSLPASSQLQLSESSTKLDDTYLPFAKPATGAEHETSSWLSTSIAKPKPPFHQVPPESWVVADHPVESLMNNGHSPSLHAENGFGSDIASVDNNLKSTSNSTFIYGKETGVHFRTKLHRGGTAFVAQQRTHKEASQRDGPTASIKRSSRPFRMVAAGQSSLKPTSAKPIRETTEKLSQAGGRTRATSVAGSVRDAPWKRDEHREREVWQTQKSALAQKFGTQGWAPRKRLSPDALDGIRALHAQYPEQYTTPVLADQFKVSPEAIRRILKSSWRPSEEEEVDRRQRWDKRGEIIWGQMVEIGIKPPKKWREMGVGTHSGDSTMAKRQKGSESTALLGKHRRSKFGDTHSGRPEYYAFTKGSLADRIL